MRDAARVLIFARAPVPGRTKTRLAPALGPEGAARLHASMLLATCERICGSTSGPVELWTEGEDRSGFFSSLQARFGIGLHTQQGRDLGARMAHAAKAALQKAECVVLIGSDCPDLDGPYLQSALELLEAGNDVVLGPAEDGGYVLLGMTRFIPELFANMPWGTGSVCAETRARLAALDVSYALLKPLFDIDRPEDYRRYLEGAGNEA